MKKILQKIVDTLVRQSIDRLNEKGFFDTRMVKVPWLDCDCSRCDRLETCEEFIWPECQKEVQPEHQSTSGN